MNKEKDTINIWWFVAGGFLLVVLVAAAGIGFVAGRGTDEPDSAQTLPAESEEPPAEAGQPTAAGSQCDVSSADQEYPLEAPEAEWELYANVLPVPTSAEYGPGIRDADGFWHCYSHSPTGAVLAAGALLPSFSFGGVREAALPGPAADSIFEREQSGSVDPADMGRYLGYRIASYEEDQATVDLLLGGAGQTYALNIRLAWSESDQDWRLDLSAGDFGTEVNPPEDQFVAWDHSDG